MLMRSTRLAACLLGAEAAAGFVYQENQAPLEKDSDIIAANFPELEGIELFSPAFSNPDSVPDGFSNGSTGPTSQFELEYFLQTLASRNEWMSYHNPDARSEEGRTLPYVYLSTTSGQDRVLADVNSYPNTTKSTGKLRVLLQGGVHGNEPAGDQGLLALLGKMDANQTWASSILANLDILVFPRYNPDGVAYFQRQLASNLDPNRDHTKMASQQTRDIKKFVMDFDPHIGADCHEYTASRGTGAEGQWIPSQDGQIAGVKNLNIHPDIRHLQETLFADSMAAALEKRGLRWSAYVTGNADTDDIILEEVTTDAKFGDASVGLGQAVMFTTETRGIRLGDQHWHRRVVSAMTMVEALVQTASDNFEYVYETIESARADYIASNEDIIVTDTIRETKIMWEYINKNNGSLMEVPVTFMNTTPVVANLTRARPEAYIFPRAWRRAADLLRDSGVVVEELQTNFKGTVAALNITSVELASSKYEGIAKTTVTTESFEKEVTIPVGGFYVSTRQKNAALAFSVLEPEAVDSYTAFNILPVEEGDEYQVYRIY